MNSVTQPNSVDCLEPLRNSFSSFVTSLSDDELRKHYSARGRIWFDTSYCRFRLTFDVLQERCVHAFLQEGRWFSQGFDVGIHVNHPHDGKGPAPGWAPDAEWVRRELLDGQDEFLTSLKEWVKYASANNA